MLFASESGRAMQACDALSVNPSAQVCEGAAELREMLAQIDPVLYPQEPA